MCVVQHPLMNPNNLVFFYARKNLGAWAEKRSVRLQSFGLSTQCSLGISAQTFREIKHFYKFSFRCGFHPHPGHYPSGMPGHDRDVCVCNFMYRKDIQNNIFSNTYPKVLYQVRHSIRKSENFFVNLLCYCGRDYGMGEGWGEWGGGR